MPPPLEQLRVGRGRVVPSAEQHNALLAELERWRLAGEVDTGGGNRAFPHPWKVTASRLTEKRGLLDPGKTWCVTVQPGAINDTLPTILYRRENDPRGWTPGRDYVCVDATAPWVERDLLDDPDDPPCLTLSDPDESNQEWSVVSDEARPLAFRSAADWELELWRAHVILSARPFRISHLPASLPPPRNFRFRVYAVSKLPAVTFGAEVGGWLELATLYLLRDPRARQESARVEVRARTWFSLWSMVIKPTGLLPPEPSTGGFGSEFDLGALNDLFAEVEYASLERTVTDLTVTEFWTV